jgi:16S rRNA (cytosine1402-N4)-methyltransferase
VVDAPPDPPARTRRPRYPGRNPRTFDQKYKELDAERYADDVQKIRDAGKTPAGSHVPIMVGEVLECLRPQPGDIVVDCTLGGGGHARALLERVVPGGGRLIGLDIDPLELPRTVGKLAAAGFSAPAFTAHLRNFAGLPKVLAEEGLAGADLILADLGVSSMQLDNPARGFSWKGVGPLDMRMNPSRGEPASRLIARLSESDLAALLRDHADEPHADRIARVLKRQTIETTHALERLVRTSLASSELRLDNAAVKLSVRRTFQALRIAVNDEFGVLDSLLRVLPGCLEANGRVAILTFHSGEDRRVKKAFQRGQREGIYSAIATEVIRPGMEETRANRRATAAKLRWAVRSP